MQIKKYEGDIHPRHGSPLSLREAMGKIFDESFWDPFDDRGIFSSEGSMNTFPKINVSESEKEVKVVANIPGVDPEKINIEVDEDTLVLSGQIEEEKESSDERHYRFEREFGEFYRDILLPSKVDPDKVLAQAKDGVVTINLPKSVDKESRKKIEIKKSS